MIFKPHDYQQHAIKKIFDLPAVGLFLDMGMGKTVCALTVIAELLYDWFSVAKVLIIAPKRVAEDTWSRETAKWEHIRHLKIAKVLGTVKQRKAALESQADMYVINRENTEWLVDYYKQDWPFDMVVIDELSSFKSSKAKRFRALRKVRPFIKRIVGLTGTPAPNGLIDLWPQIYLLDQGERLGKTVTGYRDMYFKAGRRDPRRGIVFEWKPKAGAEEEIYEKISDICISMQAKDYLQLPERVNNVIPVTLPAEAQDKYEQLEKDLLLEFTESDVVADTAAVLSNKLLQLANGAVYDEDKAVKHIHDAKLDALEDVIEAANGKPVLVYYAYRHDRDRIKAKFKIARFLDTEKDIADWNDGKVELLLAHPASAGHGLNLQAGGHIIVWFGLTWSLELYQQGNARLDRQGQRHNVIVHHLVAEGTIDEDVMKAIEGKALCQDALLEGVKARIRSYKQESLSLV